MYQKIVGRKKFGYSAVLMTVFVGLCTGALSGFTFDSLTTSNKDVRTQSMTPIENHNIHSVGAKANQIIATHTVSEVSSNASDTSDRQAKVPQIEVSFTPEPIVTPSPTPKPTPKITEESKKAEKPTSIPQAPKTATVPAGESQAIAHSLVQGYGWSESEFTCLVNLWNKESNWNHLAENSSSGAYGIPQSLPGSKMASVGEDWRTNPTTQITWGLNYINGRYGTPCGAWGHSQQVGWY